MCAAEISSSIIGVKEILPDRNSANRTSPAEGTVPQCIMPRNSTSQSYGNSVMQVGS